MSSLVDAWRRGSAGPGSVAGEGSAQDQLQRSLVLQVLGLGDALLQMVGFEREELFLEGIER